MIKRVIIEYLDGSKAELEDGVLLMRFSPKTVYRHGVGEFESDDAQHYLFSNMIDWLKERLKERNNEQR